MPREFSRVTIVFSCLGHLYVHLFTAVYFVIVLALEREWQLRYHRLIELWTLGSLMVGAAALPAGMLSDRLVASRMMIVYFVGMGAASIAAGLVESVTALMLCLVGIGVFAAIYHPVGVPWLVRDSGNKQGKVLGFNGVFGSLGSAVAGVVAGFLIDVSSWRAAFIVPGVVCAATGLALLLFVLKGKIVDTGLADRVSAAVSRSDMRWAFSF